MNEVVPPGQHSSARSSWPSGWPAFPQETMLADRRATIEGAGLPLERGWSSSTAIGGEVMEVAARGAARFAGGEGRHGGEGLGRRVPLGRARAARNCAGTSPTISHGSFASSLASHSARSIE